MRHSTKAILVISIFAFGMIFGPVISAVIGSGYFALSDTDRIDRRNEAWALLEAYRQDLPPKILFLSHIDPEVGKACGYDPDKLVPGSADELEDGAAARQDFDYSGYFVLESWRENARDDEYLNAVALGLELELSTFETAFLRRCISTTVFSSVCRDQISSFGDKAEQYGYRGRARNAVDKILCIYVDGMAARRGLPLSERD